jgi:flagellar hook protein FlgE
MTLLSSLYIGASGLAANSLELAVVGDNIANANTIGFKGSRAAFEDVLGQSLVGGSQLGLGTRLQSVQKLIAQGAITSTGIATDLAVSGNGMFVVQGAEGPLYTRAGQFTLNDDGILVNLDGLEVQGFQADATGNITGQLGSLHLTDQTSPPKATTTSTLRGNLDSGATVNPAPFDINDPSGTSNPPPTSVTVFDSLGAPHNVDVYFKKLADGSWEYHAVTDGANVAGGTAGTPVEVGTGPITFDANGNITSGNGSFTFDPSGGANAGQTVSMDFSGVLQHSGAQSMTTSQDGFAAGTLAGVKVDEKGQVVGSFSNGQSRVLGQVAIADVPAPDQLERIGGNLYRATPGAGEINVGAPGSGDRGSIVAGALEQSNVDLSSELVRMIVAQRSFQANSKTLSTADSLLAELIQIKR